METVNARDEWFSVNEHYALVVDDDSGRHYLSIPVSIGVAAYEEFYALDDDTHRAYLADPALARPFVEECRRRENDDLLLQKPGWNRGIPH